MTDEPYDFDRCTITLVIQLMPCTDGADRRAIVGVTSHGDAPIAQALSLSELNLPPLLARLLNQLRVEMPAREAASKARQDAAKQAAQAGAKPKPKPIAQSRAKSAGGPDQDGDLDDQDDLDEQDDLDGQEGDLDGQGEAKTASRASESPRSAGAQPARPAAAPVNQPALF